MAEKYNCHYVAFPSIGTGIYHFPLDKASKIAVKNIMEYCNDKNIIEKIDMVCFDEETKKYYEQALKEYFVGL